MHVVSCYLEFAGSMVRELGRLTELHVLLEVTPTAWRSNSFGLPYPDSRLGVVDALPHFGDHLPASLARDFEAAASVSYAVYPPAVSWQTLGTVRGVGRWVRELQPDFVHFEGESPRAAAWCTLARTPYVLAIHEISVPSGSTYSHLVLVKWLGMLCARRLILHSQAALDVLTSLHPRFARKGDVVPLGVMEAYPTFLADKVDPERRQTALFFGWLTPRKGVDRFESAAEIAAERIADTDFVVAGMPVRGFKPPVAHALLNGCRFLVKAGRLQPAELAGLVAASDVVVAPYTDARQSAVVLTAYAFRKPVVATAVGGLTEQVIDELTGLLVRVDDTEALASAIVRVLGDADWRSNAARAIERVVEDGALAWGPLALDTVRVYARAFPSCAPRGDRDLPAARRVRATLRPFRSAASLARVCASKDLVAIWKLRARGDTGGDILLHPRVLRGQPVVLRRGTTDFATFRSTFVERYHDPPAAAVAWIERVLDLGANVGFTAADIAARFPTASVVAVEMDPHNLRQAQKNTFAFGERVRCIGAAAWINDEGVSYRVDSDDNAFAVVDGDITGPLRSVPSLTIDQLIDMLPDGRADFVKMDVEGAEVVLLQPDHSAWLARVRSLNVEVHNVAAHKLTVIPRLREVLESAGFVVRTSARRQDALEAWREH